jgi:hypothetical protein
MSYVQYLVSTPFTWIALAGLFFGAAISRVSRPVASYQKRRNRSRRRLRRGVAAAERIRARMWTLFFLGLSASVLAVLSAVFVPGPEKILDPKLPWMFGMSALLAFVMLRFKRSIGIPMLMLLCVAALFLNIALEPWTFIRQETTILQFRALAVNQDSLDMELTIPRLSSSKSFVHVTGQTVRPGFDTLEFTPYLFFLGGTVAYRNAGLNSAEGARVPASSTGNSFPERVTGYFASHTSAIPGVQLRLVDVRPVAPFPFEIFSVVLAPDGTYTVKSSRPGSGS